MMPRVFILFILLTVVISGCASAPAVNPSPAAQEPTSPPTSTLFSPTPPPTGTQPPPKLTPTVPTQAPVQLSTATTIPTPPLGSGRTNYSLAALFNYNRHSLAVEETIHYTNSTGIALNELVLAVEPAREQGCFKLITLQVAGAVISSYKLESNQLKFNLPAVLAPRQTLQIDLSYELSLPEIPAPVNNARPVIFGYSARQANLVDWYPYIPPYQKDKGWLIHAPWFYGEHQVYEKADFQVDLILVNPPANLAIAAPSQAEIKGNQYSFQFHNARNFAFSASNMFAVSTTVVGGVSISSYAFSFDAAAGRTALNDAAQALELFSRLFGPYPHTSLAVVEADFNDGMEFDGLYFLSKGFYSTYDGTPKGYLTMVGAHEMAHQWWYGIVANDQATEPWLDEALSTYCEFLFYRAVYPDQLNWWWSYRVDFYEPTGWVNLKINDYNGYIPYRNGVYLRGARFLDQLRRKIGDSAFLAFLKEYATRNKDQVVSAQDFFTLLAKHSSANIDDLKKTFFKP